MMYAIKGSASGELLSFKGRVILHPVRREMEWLMPAQQIVELTGSAPQIAQRLGRPVMLLKNHPGMASVRWPLRKEDFRART